MRQGGEREVRALLAQRKAALVAFNNGIEQLSQLEDKFKAIYQGKLIVNHETLLLLREEFKRTYSACGQNLGVMSADQKEDCSVQLEPFTRKKDILERVWYTDVGPIATPVNAILRELGRYRDSPNNVVDPNMTRQLTKCSEQIQATLKKGYGYTGEADIGQLRGKIQEIYEHYQHKILQLELTNPSMRQNEALPDFQTFFNAIDNSLYEEITQALDAKEQVVHEIAPTRAAPPRPPPPPGPSPTERLAAMKKALREEVQAKQHNDSDEENQRPGSRS